MSQCLMSRQVEAKHQRLVGSLQPLSILERKWEYITMDFVTIFLRTLKGNNAIWLIVDRLTKSAYFFSNYIPFMLSRL